MPDVLLSERQQRALRSRMAADVVPGRPLPHPRLLERMVVLIPGDTIEVALADAQGHLVDLVALPRAHHPAGEVVDELLASFPNGADLVARLALDRFDRPFKERDVAVLSLLEPVCERLFSERPTPHLPPELTDQERRVLRLVAAGRTNAQVAARLSIAPSTVGKHLEHIYPKLGVTNRFAAAHAFESHPLPVP